MCVAAVSVTQSPHSTSEVFFIAYFLVEVFIPLKLSACVKVAVIVLLVALNVGAVTVGGVLSI